MATVEMKLKEIFSFERIDYTQCSRQYCECDLYLPHRTRSRNRASRW